MLFVFFAGTYKYIQGAREDIGDNNNNNSNNNSTSVGKVNTGYEDNEENEWSTAHSKSPEERANSLGPGKRPQARTKPLKEWLKDARLYKVRFESGQVSLYSRTCSIRRYRIRNSAQ